MARISFEQFSGGKPIQTVVPSQKTPALEDGLFSRVSNVINTAGRNVQEAISGEGQYAGQSPITRGFQAAGAAALAVPQTIAAVAPEPVRKAGEFIGEQAGKGFDVLTDEIASTKLFSDIGKLEAQGFINPQDNPEFYRLKEQLQVAKSSGDVASSVLSAQGTASTLQTGANIAGKGVTAAKRAISTGQQSILGKIDKPEVAAHVMDKVSRLKPSEYQKFQEMSGGDSIGEYLTKTGNTQAPDKIILNEAKKFAQSKADVDSTLAQIPGKFKNDAIKETLKGVQERAKAVSSGKIKPAYNAELNEFIKAYNEGGLDMSQINALKRLYEREVRLSYKKDITAGANLAKATEVDSALRNWQFKTAKENGFANLAEMNKQTQLSKFIVDKLGNQMVGKSGLNDINLTDWVILSGGDPTAVGGFLTKKFFSSKAVQAKVAQLLNDKDVAPYIAPEYKPTVTKPSKQQQ